MHVIEFEILIKISSLLEYYKWNGLLTSKYNNFLVSNSQSGDRVVKTYYLNPNYPKNPSSYHCKSTLYQPAVNQLSNYGLRYIGYISVPDNAHYHFRMACDDLCQFNITIPGPESSHTDYSFSSEIG